MAARPSSTGLMARCPALLASSLLACLGPACLGPACLGPACLGPACLGPACLSCSLPAEHVARYAGGRRSGVVSPVEPSHGRP